MTKKAESSASPYGMDEKMKAPSPRDDSDDAQAQGKLHLDVDEHR